MLTVTTIKTAPPQPEMVEYGFAISPGTENFFSLDPKSIHAGERIPRLVPDTTTDESLHGIDPLVRQCFLQDERWLR